MKSPNMPLLSLVPNPKHNSGSSFEDGVGDDEALRVRSRQIIVDQESEAQSMPSMAI